MLERQRMNGAVMVGFLMGMPVVDARATVMEFDEEGLTRMRPSVNYLQRARVLAHKARTQVSAGALKAGDTGWIAFQPRRVALESVETAQPSSIIMIGDLASEVTDREPAIPNPVQFGGIDVALASYIPMGFLPGAMVDEGDDPEESEFEEIEPDEVPPESDDAIIETSSGSPEPSLDALELAIPLEAITMLGANATKRPTEEDASDTFPHLADDPLAQLAAEIALEEGVPPALFLALVEAESGFDMDAVSVKGAIGLTQLMPGTAEELGVDPEDPVENMTGGARYLAAQFKRFGAWDLALAAYNAGPTRVARLGAVPDYAETRGFVARVLKGAAQSPVRLANLN